MRRVLALILLLPAALAHAADGELRDRQSVDIAALLAASDSPRLHEVVAPLQGQVDVAWITYLSDGLEVSGYLAVPRAGEDLPCLIFCRGGNRQFGAFEDQGAVAVLGPMAARGYVVVAPQYRGNDAGEGREEFGGAEVADVLNLIPLLEQLERADAGRLGIYGHSRGGLMAYLALARTDRFAAAVVAAGLSDSYDMIARRPELEPRVYAELVPDWETDREAALTARSPVRWADRLCPTTPILVLHGTADWRVHPSQALHMSEALLEARIPYRLVMFEGADHGLLDVREEVAEMAFAWFDRFVRDRAPLPDLDPHGD